MSADALSTSTNRPFRLILIDEDSVFRLGLRVWLERFADLEIVAEAQSGEEALQALASAGEQVPVDLAVLDIGLGRSQPDRVQGLVLCQVLRTQYPALPILLLGTASEPLLQAAAEQAGATGYGLKSLQPDDLVAIVRRVATGRKFFDGGNPALIPVPAAPLTRLRQNLRRSGNRQIEAALTEVNDELRGLELSLLDRAILAGRQRELRAARKLVNWLLPAETKQPALISPVSSIPSPSDSVRPALAISPQARLSTEQAELAADPRQLQSMLFDAVLAKLPSSLENDSDIPLETDILREDKKRDLFYLILRQLEEMLDELRYSAVLPDQLEARRSRILLDLWQHATANFLGKYFTVSVNGASVEVVDALMQNAALVQAAILDKIPGVVELLAHLLFQAPLAVNSTPYPPGNPEALSRAELLTENLLIQVANAVMQPLLNQFAHVEIIKQGFYKRQLLSHREIERMRNDLSWKYRMERLFREPQSIFESQYSLLVFSWKGIRKTSIYAPRNLELEQLSGIPLAVTLALETRDAIAPRLQSVVSFVGNGVIYILTEVIGRSIGLVGRGVLKGVGNAWQDQRTRR